MILYDRSAWWTTCFALRGTVLPHVLGRVGLLTAFSVGLYLLNELVMAPSGLPLQELDPLGHTVLGVALGMLIVFRTNSSNNRFWEARSLWGSTVNTSRNLVRSVAVYCGPADDFARLLVAYLTLVREQLRDRRDLDSVRNLLPARVFDSLQSAKNPAQMLAKTMSEWVAARLATGRIDTITAARIENLITGLIDNQGGCEKIHKTPLPFVYAALIKQALFLYLVSLPFVLVPKMGFVGPLAVAGVAVVMFGIEEAGVEIEDPFGVDLNHLPTEDICAVIAADAFDLTAPSDK